MEKNISRMSKIFFALTFVLSCLTMNTDYLHGYMGSQGTPFIIFRLILIFSFMLIATIMCKDEIKFIIKFEPIAVCIITVLLVFDYYVTQISGSQFLFRVWWMASVFMAELTLFLTVSISKQNKNDYKEFNRRFWIGFMPLYAFILILCFARSPFANNLSINMRLGQGTFLLLKDFLHNINTTFESPLIFFGNLLIFTPLSFIIKALFAKIKPTMMIIIGTAIPFIIEGYQYIFSCGDVDIDDIVLNLAGFYLGAILSTIIYKRKIAE